MTRDYCDRDGAQHLQQKITDFWRKRGFDVDVQLVSEGFVPAMRSARTDVRSDLINGMPRFIQAQ
ncbi:MAG: phosphoglycolate phosphatase [Pseudomonadota bacterium]